MSGDRLLTALTLGLLAISTGSSIAALHFYQLGPEHAPQTSDLSSDIGEFGTGLFQNSTTFEIDLLITQVLRGNSTHPQN